MLRDDCQITFELLELADARLDLSPTPVNQLQNVSARRASTLANTDDLADLPDGQADRLRGADERQSLQDISRVRTIAGRRALGLGQ